jgi:predicted lipoprotein with Yx(FWY)xxD motif
MAQPSSRRILTAAGAVVSCLTLAAAVAAPSAVGASTHGHHKHRADARAALVKVEKSKKYGDILVDGAGRTLYFLTATRGPKFACTGSCTGLWPPLLTKGKPRAGKGLAARMLGTKKRGKLRQVTFKGHPLYLYAGDSARGQVNGEGIASFGGIWYVLSAKGAPVKAALAASKSAKNGKKGYGSGSSGSGSSGSGSSGGGW